MAQNKQDFELSRQSSCLGIRGLSVISEKLFSSQSDTSPGPEHRRWGNSQGTRKTRHWEPEKREGHQQGGELHRRAMSTILAFYTILIEEHFSKMNQFSPVQSPSRVRLFAIPWTAARQASLSITNSQSLLKLMSIKLVMPSNHLILCLPLLLLPSIFPSIRVFSSESARLIRPKYWSFSFNISPSSAHPGLISLRMDW